MKGVNSIKGILDTSANMYEGCEVNIKGCIWKVQKL